MTRAALQAICDLALPRRCAGCCTDGTALCALCVAALRLARAQPSFAATPTPCPTGYPPTWSQTTYDGPVAEMLRACKDAGRRDLGPWLGALLRGALAGLVSEDAACRDALLRGEDLLVCPMPSRPATVRERGRDHMAELARHAVRGARPLVVRRLLRVSGGGADQAGLDAAERAVNVRGTMRLSSAGRRLVDGRICIVLDDIVTTGSSLVEARKALSAGGARQVVAATVAATQRHAVGHPFTSVGSVV